MKKPLISIIVPVYKVEKYLNRCVQSIVDQTYQNLEIILVDDGSPDHCPAMCDRWAEKDPRIKVIHQNNYGISAARNTGISISAGEWLVFVDADDVVSKYLVEALYTECTGTDCLIVTEFLRFREAFPSDDTKPSTIQSIDNKSLIKALNGFYVWGALYNHNLINMLSLRFDNTLRNLEDFVWNGIYLRYVETVICIKTPLYFYRSNAESITSKCVDRQWQVSSWLSARSSILNWFADKPLSTNQKNEALNMYRLCQNNIYAECLSGNISYQQLHQLERSAAEAISCNEALLHPIEKLSKNAMPWLYYQIYLFLLRLRRTISAKRVCPIGSVKWGTKMEQTRKQLPCLDVAKWVSALLMIVIHTQPFKYYSELVNFLTARVIAPIGISVFFAISGYLLGQKFEVNNGTLKDNKTNREKLWKYQKSIMLLYLIGSAIYLLWQIPHWYISGWWGFAAIKDFIASFLFRGSYYHLWYILALLYAAPVLYLLMCRFNRKQMLWLCGFGWVIECVIYSYGWLFEPILAIQPVSSLLSHFSVIFIALFRAVPLLYIGVLVGTKKDTPVVGQWEKRLICSIAIWMVEAFALKLLSPNESQYAYLLSTPIVTYCVMQWIIHFNCKFLSVNASSALRKASLLIYILHPLIIDLYSDLQFPDGILCWLTVTVISVAATMALLYKNCSKA